MMSVLRYTTINCVRVWRTYVIPHWVAPVSAATIVGCAGYAGIRLPELVFPPAIREVAPSPRGADYGGPIGIGGPSTIGTPFAYGGYQPVPGDIVVIPRGPDRPMPTVTTPMPPAGTVSFIDAPPPPSVQTYTPPRFTTSTNPPVAIPEPGSWIMMLVGLISLALSARIVSRPRIEDAACVQGVAFGVGITVSTIALILAFV